MKLPDFSVGTYQVQFFIFGDNQLVSLPSMANLTQLVSLDLKRNQLTDLPELKANKQLEYLVAHTNQLISLPSLDSLHKLQLLNVAVNQLQSLPSLDSLNQLKEIVAWANQLEELPSLLFCDSLQELDVSKNKLTNLPELPENNNLKIIRVAENDVDTLPDFSAFTHLEKAILNGNRLSFQNLIPLASIDNYEIIFPLKYQQVVNVGDVREVLEKEEVCFDLNTDKNVTDVTYRWFFEGNEKATTADHLFCPPTDSISNTGYYYSEITHPLFSQLTLTTDSFQVIVEPCLEPNKLSTTITGITCEMNGKIAVNTFDQPQPVKQFKLWNAANNEEIVSSTGEFSEVSFSEYDLYIIGGTKEQCVKKYPRKIEVPIEDCLNVHISPDGDGVSDFYYFNETGEVVISDKFGNVVTKLQVPAQWKGDGQTNRVAPGLYYANLNEGEKLIKITVVY